MLFGKSGKFVYVLGEMGSAVTVMSYTKATGKLTPVQVIDTVPEHLTVENNSAELALSADGRFLYATNRGHDSITVFSVAGERHAGYGAEYLHPRPYPARHGH